MVVTGGNNADDFEKLLGDGAAFGLSRIEYAYQEGHGGIADALRLARDFVGDDKLVAMLGDNLIQGNIIKAARAFDEQPDGARIMLKQVADPAEFGVAELDGDRIVGIEEKPERPRSDYAVIGVYFYHPDVFDIIATLKPSARNELEVTDVSNAYIRQGKLAWDLLDGWWIDAGGSFGSLLRAARLVADTGANNPQL
jgi:glucose-1-phosphate thymidylyltransferase